MVKIQIEKDICDVCEEKDVHTGNKEKFICPYCKRGMCFDCIVIVKLLIKTLEDKSIVPSDNITMCKVCYAKRVFSIDVKDKD